MTHRRRRNPTNFGTFEELVGVIMLSSVILGMVGGVVLHFII